MGKKERAHDPNQAHRKEQKKAEAKKLKKQRDERKEAQYQADPSQIEKDIQRLKHLEEFRAEAGSNAKRSKKIEELGEIKLSRSPFSLMTVHTSARLPRSPV